MAVQKSVVVCGAGVVGLACAHFLAREGHKVTVIEQNPEGGDSCACGSAGYLCPSHIVPLAAPGMMKFALARMGDPRSPFYMRPRFDPAFLRWGFLFWRAATRDRVVRAAPVLRDLAVASRIWFEEFAQATGNPFSLERRGLYNICRTQEGLDHQAEEGELLKEHGLGAEVLTAEETARRQPGVRLNIVGSVYFPDDAHLYPPKLMETMVAEAKKLGVGFRWSSPVQGWRATDGRISAARTPTGEVLGDEFVIAAGSWSQGLAGMLGLRLPIEAGKGYSLTLPRPPQWPSAPMTCAEAKIAVTPMGDRLRFGGTMELSGMNDILRRERVRQIIETAPSYLPDVKESDFAGIQPWFGRRPVSPDGLPYVGRFRRHPNLIAACGHAMLGVTLAPATGQLVEEIISGKKTSYPLELLDPDRYG